jgi:hypothetical protein
LIANPYHSPFDRRAGAVTMKAKVWPGVASSLFCAIWLALTAVSTLATSVIVPSDDELTIGARAIVRGQVTNVASAFDEAHNGIFTYITLEVAEVYKGVLPLGTLVIKEPGGIARDRGSLIYGIPTFTVGERVLLYLDTWPDGSLRVHQWFLGKFTITSESNIGAPTLSRDMSNPNVDILGRSRGGPSTDRADFDSYTTALRRRIANTRVAGWRHEATYYASAPLRLRPLELSEPLGSIQFYTFINPSQPPRWFEPDSGQQVIFRINSAGAYNSQSVNSVLQAMSAWSTVSSSALRVASGGSTTGCGLLSLDGENTVSFNNCDNYSAFSPSSGSCSGVLGAAGIVSYTLAQSRVINGVTFYRALEGNVSFNPYAACYLGNSCNFAEVATHELGHALGLGHSSDTSATMYPYAHFDGRCAGLGTDDANAIRFMYPGSSTPPTQFNDVPTSHQFYTEIGKVASRGVIEGCGGGNFCPNATVTRGQMAAYIIRALGQFNPPQPARQRFLDVSPTNPFYAFIEQMALRQITSGCSINNYCPNAAVTRAQMAAFIIRALHSPGYIPPTPAQQRYLDVPPSNPFYAHIEEMAGRQITLGCASGYYCPNASVTRAQMAAFLVRAFNW